MRVNPYRAKLILHQYTAMSKLKDWYQLPFFEDLLLFHDLSVGTSFSVHKDYLRVWCNDEVKCEIGYCDLKEQLLSMLCAVSNSSITLSTENVGNTCMLNT